MQIDRIVRGAAGTVVVLSAALTYFHSPWWLLLTAFVGLNLVQSAFTNTCPLIAVLKKLDKNPA